MAPALPPLAPSRRPCTRQRRTAWRRQPPPPGELAAEQVVRLPEGEPVRFDPGVTSGGKGLEMLQNLFEGLVFIDQRDGSLQLGVAEAMDVNDEQTEFTFTVRDGVTWSDGTPLNANDFEWSWKRVLDPETKSEYTTALYPLKNAAQIDAGEMPFDDLGVKADRREDPAWSPWRDRRPSSRSWPPPGPTTRCRATSSRKHGDAWVEAGNMVSNGPYVLTGWEHDQSMTLERNEQYYGDKPTITRGQLHPLCRPRGAGAGRLRSRRARPGAGRRRRSGAGQERSGPWAADAGFPALRHPLRHLRHHQRADRRCAGAAGAVDGDQARHPGQRRPQGRVLAGADDPAPGHPRLQPEAARWARTSAKAKQLLADAGYPMAVGFPELTLTYTST